MRFVPVRLRSGWASLQPRHAPERELQPVPRAAIATAAQNRGAVASSGSLVRGRPRVWVRGHAARLHVAGRGTRWSKAGVPGLRVTAMFEFLVRTYGTQPAVAQLLGISDSMVSLLR